ncbi:MAG: SidA/IucD/PvdA family monooxygenase [Patulibacter sp.]|nr:SidA/IucD/PvdA family monooxygenase [Patulibacter sp.]
MSRSWDLLVVGAGAKATAVAAKVHAINRLGLWGGDEPLSLLIVEAVQPAASWSGICGMTSGDEELAITPHKDIGFPYESHRMFGDDGARIDAVLSDFSWQRHLIDTGGYARWLNAESPPITHRDYGRYLEWALARATDGVELRPGTVDEVRLETTDDGERWRLDVTTPDGAVERHRGNALMLTGPGGARVLPHDPEVADRIVGCDAPRGAFDRLPRDVPSEIAIVGGGESAIATMVYLRRAHPEARLTVHTPEPPLSRGESFLENRVYSDPDSIGWEQLDEEYRRRFIHHTDRGVFGPAALAKLAHDPQCAFVAGRVAAIRASGARARVEHEQPTAASEREYDLVSNCTGFDLWSAVRRLIADETHTVIATRIGDDWDPTGDAWGRFGRGLDVAGLTPPLHIPGLAALSQGPGFANLGCLGLLANRVVQRFVLQPTANGRERTVA